MATMAKSVEFFVNSVLSYIGITQNFRKTRGARDYIVHTADGANDTAGVDSVIHVVLMTVWF